MSNEQCSCPSALKATFEVVSRQVSLQETGESWSIIEQGIVKLAEYCNSQGYESVTEIIAGIRSLSRPLNSAISSKRTKLSGAAIKLVTDLLAGLGPAFEPLVLLFIQSLLGLCAQTNKVLTRRAKECVFAVIRGTQSPSILQYLAESANHKSASLRLVAAEGILVYLNCVKPLDIENDSRHARLLEDVIKMTARDANVEVRKAGAKMIENDSRHARLLEDVIKMAVRDANVEVRKAGAKMIDAYKALLPDRAERLHASSVPHETTGRARPVAPLLAQKITSGKPERQTRPLSSKLPRDIPPSAVRPIAVSKVSAHQSALPLCSNPAPSSIKAVVRPSVSTTQRPQQVGNMLTKARDDKPHVSEGAHRVQVPLPQTSNTETIRAIRKTAIATRIHSVSSTTAATVLPSSRTVPRPLAKAEHPVMRGTSSQIGHGLSSTEVERQTSASLRSVSASRSGQQAVGQKKPVWGGRPLTMGAKPVVKAVSSKAAESGEPPQAHTSNVVDVSRYCIDATASMCDVEIQGSHSKTPPAHRTPLSSLEGGGLCTSSDVPQFVRRSSNCLPRALKQRRDSIYIDSERLESPGDCVDVTLCDCPIRPLVSCIQRGSAPTPPSHDVSVPRNVSPPYIEVGPEGESLYWARGAKFAVCMDDTDNLGGVRVAQSQFSLDAPSVSSAPLSQSHRKARPSSQSRRLKHSRFEPTSLLSPIKEVASTSFTGHLEPVLDTLML
ncbi:hypothetical protein AZE42_05813 [Rhizopogon vesiculosus]|uniref:CLASP N-terminal domain-containing protein n=1 Tax=Rhizopogon vesiculosus TaxID=180088 RepID=A0A1J8R3G2_9AGAM|nr:hypothetical protein AZE42_05813 [Rhizopogon vesiculosus]